MPAQYVLSYHLIKVPWWLGVFMLVFFTANQSLLSTKRRCCDLSVMLLWPKLNMLAESLSKRSFVFSSGKSRCLLVGSVYVLLKSRFLVASREHPQLQMPLVQNFCWKAVATRSCPLASRFPKIQWVLSWSFRRIRIHQLPPLWLALSHFFFSIHLWFFVFSALFQNIIAPLIFILKKNS